MSAEPQGVGVSDREQTRGSLASWLGNQSRRVFRLEDNNAGNDDDHPIDDLAGAGEAVLLAVVSRAASWGASIPNAIMVARSAESIYGLTWPWALTIAVSLELIGHALVEHWQSAKSWNETKRQADPAANTGLALGLTVGFWIVDFVMVAALAVSMWAASGDWRVFVSLCYPLIGVAVAVVTNERAYLFRIRQAAEMDRQQRAAKRRKRSGVRPETGRTLAGIAAEPGTVERDTLTRARYIYDTQPGITGSELGRQLGLSEQQGRNLRAAIVAEAISGSNGNGHGHD